MAAKNSGSTPRRTRKAASVQSPMAVPAPEGVEKFTSVNLSTVDLEDEIRRRAYEIYLQRGSNPGSENEDWLIAEREVRSRAATAGHSA
ncbi:MAG TPA: DUF2934 domain-containing protein [Terriglobales bacterium]|nr:DUF2934 domain-containing protein [Terriglobales bacterium]